MADEKVTELLEQVLVQVEAQQQALVRLTEVLDQHLKNPVRVDVVANSPKVSLTDNNSVGINPANNHVVVDNFREFRDRNAPGVDPCQAQTHLSVGFPGNSAEKVVVDVPAGKRLVIESITTVSQNARVFLRTIAGGNTVSHPLPAGAGQPILLPARIYADPGTAVILRVEQAQGEATIIISGHFVSI